MILRFPRWNLQLFPTLNAVAIAFDEVAQIPLKSYVVGTIRNYTLNLAGLIPLRRVGPVADLVGLERCTGDVVELAAAHSLGIHVRVEAESDPDAAQEVVCLVD